MADDIRLLERVSLGALFLAFLNVSLFGAGGGIVWAHRIAVDQRQWTTEEEFAEIVSLCQFMPGPNVVGIAVCVGAKLRGSVGAAAAVLGFLLIPWTIGFAFGVLFLQYAHIAVIRNILGGVSAAAAGLDTPGQRNMDRHDWLSPGGRLLRYQVTHAWRRTLSYARDSKRRPGARSGVSRMSPHARN